MNKNMYSSSDRPSDPTKPVAGGNKETDSRLVRLAALVDAQETTIKYMKNTINELSVTNSRLTTTVRALSKKVDSLDQQVQNIRDNTFGTSQNG